MNILIIALFIIEENSLQDKSKFLLQDFWNVEIKPLKQNSHCDTAKGFKTVLSMPYLVSKKRAIAQFTRSCSNRHSFHKTTCCKNKKEGRVATDHDNWCYGACKKLHCRNIGAKFYCIQWQVSKVEHTKIVIEFSKHCQSLCLRLKPLLLQ